MRKIEESIAYMSQITSECSAFARHHFFALFFLFFFEFFEEADTVDYLEMTDFELFDSTDSKLYKFIGVTLSFPRHSSLVNFMESFSSSSCSISISSFAKASCRIDSLSTFYGYPITSGKLSVFYVSSFSRAPSAPTLAGS